MAVGVIVEKAAYKPVREKGNSMTALITAIAMSLLLENGSQAIFGADFQTVPTIFHLPSIAFGKLKLPGDTLLTIVIGLVIMVGLQLFVKFTKQGKAMRARLRRQGGRRAHGYQRELHHRPDIRHRLRSGRGRLADVLRPPTRRSRL